jgi:serine protease Do
VYFGPVKYQLHQPESLFLMAPFSQEGRHAMKKWSGLVLCLAVGGLTGGYFFGPLLHGQPPRTTTIPRELTSYRDIVKTVLPAVVSIDAERVARNQKVRGKQDQNVQQVPGMDDPRIPEEFRKFFEDFNRKKSFTPPFEMPDQPRLGFGSGFVVDPNGVILTNFHVVNGANRVTVHFLDGRKFVSEDIHGDRKSDLAVIRIDTKGAKLPYLELGDSDQMEIGDRVLAVGAPFGLAGSVTQGIISAKGRNGLNLNMYEDFLQTDAAINPGNSGGPLVNLEGKVVGINSAIKSRSGGFNGVGLAVASNLARSVKDALLKDGVVHRGYLGVQVRELAPEISSRLGLEKNTGVVVGEVFSGTPAGKAGLRAGDIITRLNGKAIRSGHQLQLVVAGLPLNKSVSLDLLRDGQRQSLPVTIEEQPGDFDLKQVPAQPAPSTNREATTLDRIGVAVLDLTPQLATELGYDAGARGVVITQVQPGGLAANAGLRRGMLIVKVDHRPVADVSASRKAIAASSLEKGVLLQVRSPQGGTNYVLLQASGN